MIRATTVGMFVLLGVSTGLVVSVVAGELAAAVRQEQSLGELHFVDGGKARSVLDDGSPWKAGEGWLEGSGTGSFLYGNRLVGEGDFTITARFTLAELNGTAASLVFGGNHFGFDGREGTLFIEGPDGTRRVRWGQTSIMSSQGSRWTRKRPGVGRGSHSAWAGKEILSVPFKGGAVGLVGLRPWRGTMRVYGFAARGNLVEDREAVLNVPAPSCGRSTAST